MKKSIRDQTVMVIGAGVCGAAVAQRLTETGTTVIVVEKNTRIADGVTSRNSGVVHAGLYYPKGSLKSASCIAGNRKLYAWCDARGVPYKRTGKWIVGGPGDEAELQAAFQYALDAGAEGLRMGTRAQLAALSQFGVNAAFGYFSENTGIVDAYSYTKSLRVAAEQNGATYSLGTEVRAIHRKQGSFEIETSNGNIECDQVINAAGLASDEIHRMLGFEDVTIHPYRGDYFRLTKAYSCPHLIYPLKKANAPGLGIHLTLELDGSLKLGPDVSLVSSKSDFSPPAEVSSKRREFWLAASKYLTNLQESDLTYDTCGIRPKLRAPADKAEKDFLLQEFLPGYVALLGIESPGLTAALDLADRVAELIT